MERRNNFDLIRLFAAFQVMFSHSMGHLKLPHLPEFVHQAVYLFPGVAVFFVVSGFLISGSVLHSRAGLVTYFRNRALRIYPALWFNVVLLLLAMGAAGSLRFGFLDPMLWKWAAVTMISTGDWIANQLVFINVGYPGGFFPINGFISGVLWTLPIEMSFYILLPLIIHPVRQTFSLIFWTCASAAFFLIVPKQTWVIFVGHYLWIFMVGVALQVHWAHIRTIFEGKGLYWLGGYLILGALYYVISGASGYSYGMKSVWPLILTPIMGCTVIALAFTRPQTAEKLLKGNDISYGMYLWHMPVIYTALGFGLSGNWAIALLCWIATTIVATISWRLIEMPALELKKRRPSIVSASVST